MKRALISVSDKTGVVDLARYLFLKDFCLISTGGTYNLLVESFPEQKNKGLIQKITSLTHFPEILGGRVKTLHPNIYGGLLARADSEQHMTELADWGIGKIDLVCVNLYPFHLASAEKLGLKETQELIDIGGVSLLRAGAKNFQDVIVLSRVIDYKPFMYVYDLGLLDVSSVTGLAFRKEMSQRAFQITSAYDRSIQAYLASFDTDREVKEVLRSYSKLDDLKYGCNPHQTPASVWNIDSLNDKPFTILNGQPGYINYLDAINAWQLVSEARDLFCSENPENDNLAIVASFKHTSPAGVAVRKTLAEAYITARDSDPMSSFGDFVALSQICDFDTAKLIKMEVSDGIVAPGYTDQALEILKMKKKGKYIILKANPYYRNTSDVEYREMYGIALSQPVNRAVLGFDIFSGEELTNTGKRIGTVTQNKTIPIEAQHDLLLANITMKYAQSNNIVLAYQGQVIAVAAGQQSRVDCVKLACRKLSIWWARRHPSVTLIHKKFRTDIGLKRNDRVNCIIRYVEGDFTDIEYQDWCKKFTEIPPPLTHLQKHNHLATLTGVSMASDAFFPFRDNIDHASKVGVSYVIQPGGSMADKQVIEACNQYNMTMVFSGVRVFTH